MSVMFLDIEDTARNKTNKNTCLQGVHVPVGETMNKYVVSQKAVRQWREIR